MDNRGRELYMTWAFFFAPRACGWRAIAHGVSGISGFGLGCQLRRVGILGWWWGFWSFEFQRHLFRDFGSMFLVIFGVLIGGYVELI